jgi:hypothetical protein
MRVGGQGHAPVALTTVNDRYPSYKNLCRPQGWSCKVRKISPPKRLELRTVHPVARRYIHCAIPAHCVLDGFKSDKLKLWQSVTDRVAILMCIQMELLCYVTVILMVGGFL